MGRGKQRASALQAVLVVFGGASLGSNVRASDVPVSQAPPIYYRLTLEGAMFAGGDPVFARMLRLGHFTSWLHCTDAVGRGGFQGEVGHYHMDACSGHAKL
jgi:hypothetical protein